jgi:hypothetical protein
VLYRRIEEGLKPPCGGVGGEFPLAPGRGPERI